MGTLYISLEELCDNKTNLSFFAASAAAFLLSAGEIFVVVLAGYSPLSTMPTSARCA